MERLLHGAGWRREEHRFQTPASSQRIARTPALSRPGASGGSAPKPGHISHTFPNEMPLMMTNEKESLRGLNDRFAGFIEKVHRLESQNRALEKEIEDIRLKAKSSTSLAKQYEPELQDLRRQVSEMALQKHQMELEQKHVEDEFNMLREKCEEEARSRAEAEESISALKKYIDNAYLAKQDMDRKAKALTDEIEFLKRNHEAEVADILTQTKETRLCAEMSGFGKGELTAALRDIRTQLEGRAFCPDFHSEQRFSNQLAKLTKAAESDREALIATKTEISQFRRQLQSKNIELDSARGMKEALERQLYDLEQRHTAEIHHYQDTIRELEQELKNTKYDMSNHVQEYHDLLNVKMALDAEIYSYRKLLEGEESRYSTFSDAQMPVPYVYRQSPVYTLPCVSRVGGVTRKAEPQYKFVEEIITETTREDIEISDTGSEDAEEQREQDLVCSEKESVGVEVESEVQLEEKETQESDAEDNTDSPKAKQLDNIENPTENDEQSLKTSTDVSVDLKEGGMESELEQNNLTVSEQNKKDTDNIEDNDTDSKTKQLDLDTQTEKPLADINGDEDVEMVAFDTKNGKEDKDQDRIKQPKPTEQTDTQEVPTEPGESAKQEISPTSEYEKAKKETVNVPEHKDSSIGKTMEKNSEVKSVEVDTSPADPQPASQKAEAGQETTPNSEADSKQSLETSQAEVLDTTKTVSAQDKSAEAQKELAEEVKTEAPEKSKVKEINSEEEKTDNKPEAVMKTVKEEKGDNAQSIEEQKTQAHIYTPALKQTEAETSERKEIQTKDMMESVKKEENTEPKQTEKKINVQAEEQTKSEEQSQKTADSTVDSFKTKSSEIQKGGILKDEQPKSTETETKSMQKPEKQGSKEHKVETSDDIKEMDVIKPKGREIDAKTLQEVHPEQSVPKTPEEREQSKEQSKDQPSKEQNMDQLSTEQSSDEPRKEQSKDEPNKEQSKDEPSTEQSKDEPNKEQNMDHTSKEQSKDEPSTEQSKDEPNKEQSKYEPNKEQNMDHASTEQSKDEPSKEQSKDELSKEQSKDEPNKEQSKDEPNKEQRKDKPSTEKSKDEPNKEQSKDEPNKEQRKDKPSTEQSKDEPNKEQNMDHPSTEQSKDEPSTEQSKDEPSTEQSKDEPSTEQSKDEPSTEQSKDKPSTEQSKDQLSAEQSKDQANKDSNESKDLKTEKSDKNDASEAKQDSNKMDTTKSKDLDKDPSPLKDSELLKPTVKEVSPEKGQDNITKADLKNQSTASAVNENGVNI